MTQDAPERIWTCNETRDIYITEAQDDTTEYVRVDTLDVRDATIAELVEALRKSVNQTEWTAGLIHSDSGRDKAFDMAFESRKALNRLAARVEKESE